MMMRSQHHFLVLSRPYFCHSFSRSLYLHSSDLMALLTTGSLGNFAPGSECWQQQQQPTGENTGVCNLISLPPSLSRASSGTWENATAGRCWHTVEPRNPC